MTKLCGLWHRGTHFLHCRYGIILYVLILPISGSLDYGASVTVPSRKGWLVEHCKPVRMMYPVSSTLLRCSVVLCCFLSGCATVVYGTRQQLTFESEPAGATVVLHNSAFQEELRYNTPVVIELPKNISPLVTFRKDGFQPQQIELDRDYHILALIGNILTLGYGFHIDFVTGGAWSIHPDTVKVQLVPESTGDLHVSPSGP